MLLVLIAGKFAAGRYHMRRTHMAWETGIRAYESGELEAAAEAFGRCVKFAPIWVVARRMLGRTLMHMERTEEAEEQYRFATQLEPRNGESYLDYACFLATLDAARHDEALDMLELGVEYAPDAREKLHAIPSLAPLMNTERFQALVTRADAQRDRPL